MDNRDPHARLVGELGELLVDHIERHHPEASRFAAIKALGAAAKALAMGRRSCRPRATKSNWSGRTGSCRPASRKTSM